MKFEGGCYVADGEPRLKAQCHCRECQYISGGAPNMFMLVEPQGFRYTSGEPRKFSRSDLEKSGDTRILRRMRHSSGNATTGSAIHCPKGRHA